jgi:DNA polymerase III subunit delta
VITLIHGPAELLRSETLAKIRAGITGNPDLVDLNLHRLDGRQILMADLRNACDTMPFLAERRLVVVEGFLHRLVTAGKGRARPTETSEPVIESAEDDVPLPELDGAQTKALLAYLDQVPDTTELVFLEDDVLGGGTVLRRLLELQRDGAARIVLCQKPKRNELPDWIRQRAHQRGVKLDGTAVIDLAEFVGDDLRQLDQELIKLADYAGKGRSVTRDDVRRLVPATRAANVFEMVEALGLGDAPRASRLMQHALDVDGEQPLRLIGMISRQYRLIIQAKALQAAGVKQTEVARQLSIPDWTAPKLLAQANRLSFTRLENAMERILAADEAIKTGRLSDREAMDVLLAQLLEA